MTFLKCQLEPSSISTDYIFQSSTLLTYKATFLDFVSANVTFGRKSSIIKYDYSIGNEIIQRTESITDLGVVE